MAGSRRSADGGAVFRDRSKPLAFERVRAIFVLRARGVSLSQPY